MQHQQHQINQYDHYNAISVIVEEQIRRAMAPLYEALDFQIQEITRLKDEIKLLSTENLMANEIAMLRAEMNSLTKALYRPTESCL